MARFAAISRDFQDSAFDNVLKPQSPRRVIALDTTRTAGQTKKIGEEFWLSARRERGKMGL